MSTLPTGFLLYNGRSMLDGSPIACVLTLRSANRKTGPTIQSWIIRTDVDPIAAAASGADASICGNCPLRPSQPGAACYVNLGHAPRAVYRKLQREGYPQLDMRRADHRSALAGRVLRLGSYGDPAALPISAWRRILPYVAGHVGYTHQWRSPIARPYRSLCMASVETIDQQQHAIRRGWRTFRARSIEEDLGAGETICPASEEGGQRVTCDACLLCNGKRRKYRKSIAIYRHGFRIPKRDRYVSIAIAS